MIFTDVHISLICYIELSRDEWMDNKCWYCGCYFDFNNFSCFKNQLYQSANRVIDKCQLRLIFTRGQEDKMFIHQNLS